MSRVRSRRKVVCATKGEGLMVCGASGEQQYDQYGKENSKVVEK
jgi:hypothetical protein